MVTFVRSTTSKSINLQSRDADGGQLQADLAADGADADHRDLGLRQPVAGHQILLAGETVLFRRA